MSVGSTPYRGHHGESLAATTLDFTFYTAEAELNLGFEFLEVTPD